MAAPHDLSAFSSALKEVLLPYIQNNFPKKTILLDQVKRSGQENYINDEFVFPLYTSRHGGIANLADDGNNISQAGGRALSRGTVPSETVTGAFDITKKAIDASKSSQGAVESALGAQSDTLLSDFMRHLNRQFHADGVGVVGQALGSVGAGTVSLMYPDANLDDGRSIDWYGTINSDIAVNKYFAVDQIVGIGTGGVDLGTVTSVTGTSLVMTGSPAIVANDSIYIMDGSGEGAGTSEFLGMRAALSSTTGTNTYAGVARSVTGWAPQFGSASEALTLSRITKSYLKAKEYSEAQDLYAIFVNFSLFQKYGDVLTAMRRQVDSLDLVGGWSGLAFEAGAGKAAVFLDYDTPDGEIEIVNLKTWTICQVEAPNWMEEPNTGALLRKQNTIQYQAVLVWFANLFCGSPAANGRETRKTS